MESDKKVELLKGAGRPIFEQKERAEMLAAMKVVDIIILLPTMRGRQPYTDMIEAIKPEVIAVTEDDPLLKMKKMEVEKYTGKLKIVISRLKKHSTSKLIKLLDLK